MSTAEATETCVCYGCLPARSMAVLSAELYILQAAPPAYAGHPVQCLRTEQ